MAGRNIGRPIRRAGSRWGGGRFAPRRKVCAFCVDHVKEIGYKDSAKLSRYISDRGRIEPRRRTGTCAKHQRALAVAIKRARHLALMPFAPEHIYKMGRVASLSPSPVPVETAPAPVKTAPAPVETAPESVKTAPVPVETAPESVKTTPKSVETVPAPVEPAPESVETAPESVETAPAPSKDEQK